MLLSSRMRLVIVSSSQTDIHCFHWLIRPLAVVRVRFWFRRVWFTLSRDLSLFQSSSQGVRERICSAAVAARAVRNWPIRHRTKLDSTANIRQQVVARVAAALAARRIRWSFDFLELCALSDAVHERISGVGCGWHAWCGGFVALSVDVHHWWGRWLKINIFDCNGARSQIKLISHYHHWRRGWRWCSTVIVHNRGWSRWGASHRRCANWQWRSWLSLPLPLSAFWEVFRWRGRRGSDAMHRFVDSITVLVLEKNSWLVAKFPSKSSSDEPDSCLAPAVLPAWSFLF